MTIARNTFLICICLMCMSALGQKCKCYTDFDFLSMLPSNRIPCDAVKGNALHYKDSLYHDVFKVRHGRRGLKSVEYSFFKMKMRDGGTFKFYIFNKPIKQTAKVDTSSRTIFWERSSYIKFRDAYNKHTVKYQRVGVANDRLIKRYSIDRGTKVTLTHTRNTLMKDDGDVICYKSHVLRSADTVGQASPIKIDINSLDTNKLQEKEMVKRHEVVLSYRVLKEFYEYYLINSYFLGQYELGTIIEKPPLVLLKNQRFKNSTSMYEGIDTSHFNMRINPQKTINEYVKGLHYLAKGKNKTRWRTHRPRTKYISNKLFWIFHGPVGFMKFLKKRSVSSIYVDASPPKWWYRSSAIKHLKAYLSDTTDAPLIKVGYPSKGPTYSHCRFLWTVGNQAEFLIMGIEQKQYPLSKSTCEYLENR